MNINFDWYNVFYYVCKFKSVTKASNFLCVSQPAVSKNIRNLENALDKKLVIKKSKGIDITKEGYILFDEISESIEKLNSTTNKLIGNNANYNQVIYINVGVSTVKSFLVDSLIEFNKKYPQIKFVIRTMDSDVSLKQLEDGRVDLIFIARDYFNSNDSNIKLVEWKDTLEYFVIRSVDKDKYPKFIAAKDFCKYPVISKLNYSVSRKYVDEAFLKKGVSFSPTYQLSTHWLVEEYVKKGLGIGLVVNNLVENEIISNEFVKIETDLNIPSRKFCYAYRDDTMKSEIIKEFIELIK